MFELAQKMNSLEALLRVSPSVRALEHVFFIRSNNRINDSSNNSSNRSSSIKFIRSCLQYVDVKVVADKANASTTSLSEPNHLDHRFLTLPCLASFNVKNQKEI